MIKHHNNNQSYHNPKDIANTFKDYYESLYNLKLDKNIHQPTETEINEFLRNIDLLSIDTNSLQLINKPFTAAEVHEVIKRLPKHKTAGADGFSAEYYQAFSSTLTPKLVDFFNVAANTGTFPSEMLQAIIVNIPKPGKDPSLPHIYRPISLLNSDFRQSTSKQIIEYNPHPYRTGAGGICQRKTGPGQH